MTKPVNARVAGVTFLVYIAAGLSGMAGRPAPLLRIVLGFVESFSALVLAVTLYRITRDTDADLAMLAFACRVGEGILGHVPGVTMPVSATFFSVGSLLFSFLFLRGRLIPVALAWLGVLASIVLVVALPVQLAGLLPRSLTMAIWLPMLVFEVPLGVWLIVRGVPT